METSLHEIAIAILILAKQHEVVVAILIGAGLVALAARRRPRSRSRDGRRWPWRRYRTRRRRRGCRDRSWPRPAFSARRRVFINSADIAGAIEQGIIGVAMQVDEGHRSVAPRSGYTPGGEGRLDTFIVLRAGLAEAKRIVSENGTRFKWQKSVLQSAHGSKKPWGRWPPWYKCNGLFLVILCKYLKGIK